MNLKLNKYLREIGYSEESFPFKKENEQYYPNKEGFITAEFYNLDHTLNLMIYSYLCYYREYIADKVTAGCFIPMDDINDAKNIGHKKWLKMLDSMIFGFKVILTADEKKQQELLKTDKTGLELEKLVYKRWNKSKKLLCEYWSCLWW